MDFSFDNKVDCLYEYIRSSKHKEKDSISDSDVRSYLDEYMTISSFPKEKFINYIDDNLDHIIMKIKNPDY